MGPAVSYTHLGGGEGRGVDSRALNDSAVGNEDTGAAEYVGEVVDGGLLDVGLDVDGAVGVGGVSAGHRDGVELDVGKGGDGAESGVLGCHLAAVFLFQEVFALDGGFDAAGNGGMGGQDNDCAEGHDGGGVGQAEAHVGAEPGW